MHRDIRAAIAHDEIVPEAQIDASPNLEFNINGRRMTIGGQYHLGTGFLGIGVALFSALLFGAMSGERFQAR